MTEIDLNRIKGNFGASYVTYRLSKYCLVRQVTEGTDIGIDLYCESFTDIGKPFLHFWVQVKTGESLKVSVDKSYASYSFKIEHLQYWHRQPVPVFAFLIPINWPQKKKKIDVYVVNLTDYLLKNKISETQKTISISSSRVLKTEADYLEFIKKDVPYFTAAQNITKGAARMIPIFDPEYICAVPTGYSINFLERIIWQLRTTAGVAIQDLFKSDKLHQKNKKYRFILTKVLEAYSEDKHWEVHYALGLAYLIDKKYLSAKKSFKDSLKMIEDDPNIDQDSWTSNKRMLTNHISNCDSSIHTKPNE